MMLATSLHDIPQPTRGCHVFRNRQPVPIDDEPEEADETYSAIDWDTLLAPVDYSDNLLGDRFLERGQGLMIFGPAGCGKSVAAEQALAEWAAGMDGLHIQPVRPLKIVILQTEDSVNDLRENFMGILESSVFTPDKISLVRRNLIILPPVPGGSGADLMAHLNAVGEKFTPDLVCVNPLLAFCEGDPTRELGGLLYQRVDPTIKRWNFGFVGIHHIPKMNNRDTSGYGSHDHQYLAAGDARVANWPRAMLQIEPVSNGVYRFRAAKRWSRTGWTWDRLPVKERYFRWATGSVRWVDAMPEEIEKAAQAEDHRTLLQILPAHDQPGISRERLRGLAKSRLNVGKDKADAWLKLCQEDGLAERLEIKNADNRKEASFRKKEGASDA